MRLIKYNMIKPGDQVWTIINKGCFSDLENLEIYYHYKTLIQ